MAAKFPRLSATVLATAGLAACASGPGRDPGAPVPPGADAAVRGAVFVAAEGGETRYRVEAREGVYNDAARRIRLLGVQALIRAPGGTNYRIASEEGIVRADTGDLEFPGPVAGETSDGVRIAGGAFRYDAATGVIASEAPVEVGRAGFVLRGEGFRAYPKEERFEILRSVRGRAASP